MNPLLKFDFIVDKENKTIQVKREFAAAPDLVWDAFTKQNILDQWWAPKPWMARTKSMDFKEGGRRLYAMVGPEGEEHWAFFDYEHIQPKTKFSGIDGFCNPEGERSTEMPQMRWEFNFIPHGKNTIVDMYSRFEEVEHLETIIKMGFKEGFTIAMEGLDEIFAKG